ncbi:nucleotidyltransferase family protein [Methylibium sp.]|uniref:nucleotidyltransferase family protein n=1 Tax=Methylibium sp. TaxID=2067992 RepID=UPI003D0F6CFD
MSKLKAVIQAGGRGTRLAPYSTVLPKALMPIGEGTVIDNMLKLFSEAGVSTVFITVSKFGPLIRSYCGDGSRWNIDIQYIDEDKPLGTIGPLSPIRDLFDGSFIVANSDIYIDLDIPALLADHRSKGSLLTVVVIDQTVKIEYGVLDNVAGRVVGFREKPTERFCVSTGIYCMEPGIFDFIPRDVPFGFDELIRSLLGSSTPVSAYPHPGQWIDIGRIEDLRRAQEQAASQILRSANAAADE